MLNHESILRHVRQGLLALLLACTSSVLAQECVEMGALAYDNWTKVDAGGTGVLPTGVQSADYIRCKACHGWDRMGTEGGYVRRTRTEDRPNAGAGDTDQITRYITLDRLENWQPFGGEIVVKARILKEDDGRSFTDGKGSWVDIIGGFGFRDADNAAAWARGYTLGNQHPDFTQGGANGLSQAQVDCLVEFLYSEDTQPGRYFDAIHPNLNPVLYDIVDTADAGLGEDLYGDICMDCHGDPATDYDGLNDGHPEGGILAYLAQDGKFSEFAHKVRWGIPDTIMTRDTLEDPTAHDVASLMLYLQELGGTGFYMVKGLTGIWYNVDRDGEGFNVEVYKFGGEMRLVAFFYTYDEAGNQVYLVAQGVADGDTAEVDVYITDGALWGAAFDKDDVNLEEWGTGTVRAHSCDSLEFALMPNAAMQAKGFTDLADVLTRLTQPWRCPA